jgi:hypothetical protein
MPWVIAAAAVAADAPAQAQSNLDAGKSAAQIFADTCNACHRSPREVRPTSAAFLREHYTTGGREAAAMAAYLASVGSDARAVQQRRPPTLGAGQAASPGAADQGNGRRTPEQGQPSPGAATTSAIRLPSESVEAGNLPIAAAPAGAAAETGPPQAAVAAPPRQSGIEAFEE